MLIAEVEHAHAQIVIDSLHCLHQNFELPADDLESLVADSLELASHLRLDLDYGLPS